MRLRFWSALHGLLLVADAGVDGAHRCLRSVRVFVWTRATRENLRTCNERQVRRDRFP